MTRARAWLRAHSDLIVLLAFVLGVGVVNQLATAHQVRASGHDFCAIITAATKHPVPRPADPKANPSRENAYVFYEDFMQLGQRLGCG